MYATDTYKM